jgi:hypothetical protein
MKFPFIQQIYIGDLLPPSTVLGIKDRNINEVSCSREIPCTGGNDNLHVKVENNMDITKWDSQPKWTS